MFTLVGDPHAKPDNLDRINQLFDMIEELGNDCIILGDLLDTKEVVRGKCLNTYVRRLKASKLKFWILVGNHDWFNHDCQDHALETLKNIPNVTIVDEPLDYKNYLFLPYTHNVELLKQWMQELGKGRIVFCHADIKGFDYGGKISEVGLDVKDLMGGPKAVYSGHYHKYQQEGKVTYIGAPFSHSFGEANQLKYIGVYNTLNNKLELIQTPFPRHISLEIDCNRQKRLQDNNGMDILRVVLTGTQEYIDKFHREDGVKYIEQPTSVIKASVINETESPEIQFSKWAKDIKGYSAKLLKKGLEILADV